MAENDVTSIIKCENGDITAIEKFINNGTFEASNNAKVVSKHLLNTELINVGEKLVLNPFYLKSDEWDGVIENSSKGIIKCKNGQALTKSFKNARFFDIIESMELSTENMGQTNSGKIIVGEKMELKASFAKNGDWQGMIEAKDFVLLVIGDLIFCGQISAKNASITLLSPETSTFTVHGLLSFPESILYIDYLNEDDSSTYPSIIVSGQIYAQAIYANPVYIQLLNSAQMFLNKTVNAENLKEEMMIMAKCLETRKDSIIFSEIFKDSPQIFQCQKFLHNGILVESSTKVIFDVEEMIHNGKIYYGNQEKQFECLLDATIFVKKQIENYAEFFAKHLEIFGKGQLKNFNKIEADRLKILLHQIFNKDGKMFGIDISLKITTEEEAIIDGNLFSENNLAILAQNAKVLVFKCFSHETDESNYFILPSKIKYLLAKIIEIHSNVRYSNQKNVKTTMIAEKSVKFYGGCYYTFLELKMQKPQINPSDKTVELFEINVEKDAKFFCNSLQMFGKCENGHILLNGDTNIKTLKVNEGIKIITLSGSNADQIIHNFVAPFSEVYLDSLSNFQVSYLEANVFKNLPNSKVNLGSPEDTPQTQMIIHKAIDIDGTITLSSNVIIVSKNENSTVNTTIPGFITAQKTDNSDNFQTLKINVNSIKVSGKIEKLNSCVMQSQSLDISGQLQEMKNVETNAEMINILSSGKIWAIEDFVAKGDKLFLEGQIYKIKNLATTATITTISTSGVIKEVENFTLHSEWLTHDGKIKECIKMEVCCWGTICNGEIDSEELEMISSLIFVNTGQISSTKSTYAAPFMLNSAIDSLKVTSLNASGEDACIALKSLVCLSTESQMIAPEGRIQKQAVLLFNFATVTACTMPDSKQLENWKKTIQALNERFSGNNPSLEEIQNILQLTDGSMGSNEISIREKTTFYIEIRAMVETMHYQGVTTFKVPDLVGALMRAQNHFENIVSIQKRLLEVPSLAKGLFQQGYSYVKQKATAFYGYFGFNNMPNIDPTKKGIQEVGMWSSNTGLIEAGKAGYCAYFVESYNNDGIISSNAGDIIIESKNIKQGKGKMIAAYGNILLQGKHITVDRVEAKQILITASNELKASNIDAKIAQLISKHGNIKIENAKTKQLIVQAKENAELKNIESTEFVSVEAKTGDMNAQNIETKQLQATAGKNANLDGIKSDQIYVKAEDKLDLKNVTADNVVGEAGSDINLGKMNVKKEATIKSKKGNIVVNDTIKAEKMKISGEKVSMAANGRPVDHFFGTLSIDAKRMQADEIKHLLEGSGVFKTMQVRDLLDLAVTDESLILGNMSRSCSVSLKCKDINVIGNIFTSKSFRVEAQNDINLQRNAKVTAMESADFTSKTGSINMTAATIQANDISLISDKDINIHAYKTKNERAQASCIKAGIGKKCDKRYKGVNIKSGRNVDIYASNIKSNGDIIMHAKKDIKIRAATTERSKTTKKSGFLGFNKKTVTTRWTEVDKSNIQSNSGKIVMKSDEGGITSIATNIKAQDSAYLHAKKDVKLLDLVTKTVTETNSSSFWGLSKSYNYKAEELGVGTTLVTKSHDPSVIISDEGNVLVEGSTLDCQGKLLVEAKNGKIEFKERVLNITEYTEGAGINPLALGFTVESTNSRTQIISGNHVCAKELEVRAKRFEIKGMATTTVEDMIVDAKNINFEGICLESQTDYKSFTVSIKPTSLSLNIDTEFKKSNAKEYQNLQINVGGKMRFKNAENVKITNANINADEFLSDRPLNMEITSNASTYSEECTKVGIEISFLMVGGVPVPIPGVEINKANNSGAVVRQEAGIHSRKAIKANGLRVNSLKMTSASVISDKDIEEFAKTIESNDVKEYQNSSSNYIGLKVATSPKGIQGASLGYVKNVKATKTNLKSTIASTSGIVAKNYSTQVNTDLNTKRHVLEQTEYSKGVKADFGKEGVKLQVNEYGGGFKYNKATQSVDAEFKAKSTEASLSFGKGKGGKARLKTATTEHSIELTKDKKKITIKNEKGEFDVDIGKEGAEINIGNKDNGIKFKANKNSANFEIKADDVKCNIGASQQGANLGYEDKDNKIGINADTKQRIANVSVKAGETEVNADASKDGFGTNLKHQDKQFGFDANKDGGNVTVKDGDKTDINISANTSSKKANVSVKTGETEFNADASKDRFGTNLKHQDKKFGFDANKDGGNVTVKDGDKTDINISANTSSKKANVSVKAGETEFNVSN